MRTKPLIWINTLVKNEERWIWYGLRSVLPFVDKAIVWDSGSSDNTVKIIKTIKDKKIFFKEIGSLTQKDFGSVRQKMLEQTKSDWVWILDGDEIWPKDSARQLIKEINGAPRNIQSFCVRPINFVGDIRFIHPETFSGQSPLAPKGVKGFFSTRVFRRDITGLRVAGEYGKESFYAGKLTLRERKEHVKYLPNVYYWHVDYLLRSASLKKDKEVMMRQKKRKYEIGIVRPRWIKIPEVFFLPKPIFAASPFYKMTIFEYLKSMFQTPFKKIKRILTNLF